MPVPIDPPVAQKLQQGVVLPASPLALTAGRTLDERRQRALVRYYIAAGAGGLAAGVHTTQFNIRDPGIGLFEPVLALIAEEVQRSQAPGPFVRIGGICGATPQAVREASLLRELHYHAGLLSLAALKDCSDDELIAHCRTVATIIPLFGFYLQPAVGGRRLSYHFWRRFAEIDNVVAIKIAPFNRYQTLDVVRAIADSGREDIALYTGNDDNIVLDLLTPFTFRANGKSVQRRIVGGLLGHWAVWTRRAVELHRRCQQRSAGAGVDELFAEAIAVTDCNAAFFDVAHGFAGCIPGIHEVLRRQGLLEGTWCLDPRESLSQGQSDEISRVWQAYPQLNDDHFVREHLDEWLR